MDYDDWGADDREEWERDRLAEDDSGPCGRCGEDHCNGEDAAAPSGDADPGGCFCPGCAWCREHFDLTETGAP